MVGEPECAGTYIRSVDDVRPPTCGRGIGGYPPLRRGSEEGAG